MGDDVNDVGAMRIAGLGAAPADAQASALAAASFVSRFPGGKGAVRELVDSILAARSAVAVSLSSS
jgi:3-deoxy-D-manno-octulosonate 8-phosphate phosphatase (KDO 8-P phosphatase)